MRFLIKIGKLFLDVIIQYIWNFTPEYGHSRVCFIRNKFNISIQKHQGKVTSTNEFPQVVFPFPYGCAVVWDDAFDLIENMLNDLGKFQRANDGGKTFAQGLSLGIFGSKVE